MSAELSGACYNTLGCLGLWQTVTLPVNPETVEFEGHNAVEHGDPSVQILVPSFTSCVIWARRFYLLSLDFLVCQVAVILCTYLW